MILIKRKLFDKFPFEFESSITTSDKGKDTEFYLPCLSNNKADFCNI